MKKFKFNLQAVHNVREMNENQEQLHLAELQSEMKKTLAKIDQLEEMNLEATKNYMTKVKVGESTSPFEMQMHADHISDINRRRREAQEELVERKLACANQAKKLAEAHRNVKVTDKLRETQEARHKQEFERQEQNKIDEFVTTNFARQMSGIK